MLLSHDFGVFVIGLVFAARPLFANLLGLAAASVLSFARTREQDMGAEGLLPTVLLPAQEGGQSRVRALPALRKRERFLLCSVWNIPMTSMWCALCGRCATRLRAIFSLLFVLACGSAWFAPSLFAQTLYYGGVQTTVSSGFGAPAGLAVDGSDNVYISYPYYNGTVIQVPWTAGSGYGTPVTVVSGLISPFGIAVDGSGNVYVAVSGSGVGTTGGSVVEASPTGSGSWVPTTVVSGLNSPKGVAVDGSRNMYIADSANHEVIEAPWTGGSYGTPLTLANTTTSGSAYFTPYGVAVDGSGNVFVADYGNGFATGTLAKILSGCAPAAASCQIQQLDSGMHEPEGVAVDGSGSVFVADSGFGWILELPWTGSTYSSTHLPLFDQGPKYYPSGVAVDGSGNIYFSDTVNDRVGKGNIIAVDFGTVSVGSPSATISIPFTFANSATLGSWAVLTQGATELDFADAQSGTCSSTSPDNSYSTNDGCTVDVIFTPQSAGLRSGAVVVADPSGNVLATAYLHGIGTAPQVGFLPGTQSTVGSGLISPKSAAVDGSGNVYIADSGNQDVVKASWTGSGYGPQSTLASTTTNGSSFDPVGVAVDGGGNVFIADADNSQVVVVPRTGGSYGTQSTLANATTNGSSFDPAAVAVDGSGNVYIADSGNQDVVKVPWTGSSYGTQSTLASTATNGSNFDPVGVAVDGSGNVFIADTGNRQVVEAPWMGSSYGTQSTLASTATNGSNFDPVGVAVDGSGNVYIADTANSQVVEAPWTGSGYGPQSTVANTATNGSGFDPVGLAVDRNGDIYIVAGNLNGQVLKVDVVDPPSLSFSSTPAGFTSSESPQTVTLENNGNAALSFSIPPMGTNPSIAANFALNSSQASACPLVASGSSTPGILAAGAGCLLPISFTPAVTGDLSASLVLTDNNLNGTNANQTISLSGTATEPQGPAITSGSSTTFTVNSSGSFTVTATGNPAPTLSATGALPAGVTFSPAGVLSGTPAAGAGGAYLLAITASNGVGSSATQTFTLTVDQAPAITSGSSATFTVGSSGSFTVTATGYPAPTLSAIGALPAGVTFSGGVLSGTPAAGTGGAYSLAITASNGVGSSATQTFTLTVDQAPAITNANGANFTAGVPGSFMVSTSAYPNATLSESGTLPSGVTFKDNGNGTGSLSGMAAAGTEDAYSLLITAVSATTPNATQTFTLTVSAPASFVVTTTADDASGTASNCPAGSASSNCSLRDALAAASAAGAGNITFSSSVFSASNTAAQNTIALNNGTLGISSFTTITGLTSGSGPTLKNLVTVAGDGPSSNFSVFTVNSGVTGAAIANLNITNGNNYNGGAINNSGTLTVSASTLANNSACNGGGIANSGALTVNNSTLSGNYGGGYVTGCGNGGGGIYALSGSLILNGSTLSANTSGPGGALLANGGTVMVINSTFSGNSALAGKYGGAIFINAASVTLNDSTFSGNSAAGGGAIYNDGTLAVTDSILSGDTGGECGSGSGGGCPTNGANGNIVGMNNIALAPLANYGGPTQTMIPLPESPAICAISPSNATGTDQRSEPRTTAYGATTCQDAGAVQTNYSIAFVQQPATVVQNAAMLPAPTVQLNESGVAFADGSDSIAIPLSLTTGNGALTGGSALTSAFTGIATYSALSISLPGTGDVLTANLTLNAAGTPAAAISLASEPFNVTSAVAQLAFNPSPPATVKAGSNAGTLTVDEENSGSALVSTASDTITLTVTGPGSYSNTYTSAASNGVATFNLSGAALAAAGSYGYTALIAGNSSVSAADAPETVSAASAASVAVVSGTPQTAVIGAAFAALLRVKVEDQYGNPVSGAAVAFAAPVSGASAAFTGSPAATAADGTASVTATANGTASATPYAVTGSVSGAATAASFLLTNTQTSTALTVTPAPAAIAYGQPVTITAAIAPASVLTSSPTGAVTFYDGSTALTPASAAASASASYTVNVPAVGIHTYAAKYGGDTNFTPSSLTDATSALAVSKANSTLSCPFSPVSLTYGAGDSVTVSVAGQFSGAGVAMPSGNVSYTIGSGTALSAAIAFGTARLTIPANQAAGTYTITVSYSGDGNYSAATPIPVNLVISKAAAAVTLGGLSQTYTGSALPAAATTTPANLAVTFTYNGASAPPTAAGSYTVVGTVSDANYQGSATGTLTIAKAAATVTLGGLSQTYTGSALPAAATTTPANLAVTFTYNLASAPPTAAGSYTVVGTVSDANYQGSATGTLTVSQAMSATTITSSANPVLFQNAITLSASATSAAGTPTGTVTFLDGTTPLGTGTLSGGVAILTTSSLADGTHSITAVYGGNANFLSSSSSPLTQVVEDFNFNISSSSITVPPGGAAVFTFTLSPIDGTTFPSAVTLTLSGLPPGSTSSTSPATIAEGASATTVTFTINIPQTDASARPSVLRPGAQLAANHSAGSGGGHAGGWAEGLVPISLALLLLPLTGRLRRAGRRLGRMICVMLLLGASMAVMAGIGGCGSSSGSFTQQQQAYIVTVTATSGALSHSATVNLTVE